MKGVTKSVWEFASLILACVPSTKICGEVCCAELGFLTSPYFISIYMNNFHILTEHVKLKENHFIFIAGRHCIILNNVWDKQNNSKMTLKNY